jgi:hypothetical protein
MKELALTYVPKELKSEFTQATWYDHGGKPLSPPQGFKERHAVAPQVNGHNHVLIGLPPEGKNRIFIYIDDERRLPNRAPIVDGEVRDKVIKSFYAIGIAT